MGEMCVILTVAAYSRDPARRYCSTVPSHAKESTASQFEDQR